MARVQARADAIKPGMSAAEAVSKVGFWFYIRMVREGDEQTPYMAERREDGSYIIRDWNRREMKYAEEAQFLQGMAQTLGDGHRWRLFCRFVTVLPRQAQFQIQVNQRGEVETVTTATAED